ncbi:unnamed protein product [Phytophthora fragariaefolia]|uniref:Unnamed protein product n=1 Tax=Phytophthora fragariaefolia TaxID=1490495 RepID=A0A9W7DBH4_9STRA|nr:unnamed protein product [Phytophthora fragariaefolia]
MLLRWLKLLAAGWRRGDADAGHPQPIEQQRILSRGIAVRELEVGVQLQVDSEMTLCGQLAGIESLEDTATLGSTGVEGEEQWIEDAGRER